MNNNEIFINKAKMIHGDRYDYSKVQYINSNIKVKIICNEHGEFEQRPKNHYVSTGCPTCSIQYKKTIANKKACTTELFIIKALKIHKNKYDYSKVNYINASIKIIIICNKHGEYEQRPSSHLEGRGCISCFNEEQKIRYKNGINKKGKNIEKFIEEAKKIHGNKYDYTISIYKNNKTLIKILCIKHGIFEQLPSNHLNKKEGCIDCVKENQKNNSNAKLIDKFIIEAIKLYGDKYDYSKVNYTNNYTNIIIICPIHGEFFKRPEKYLRGSGCKECYYKESSYKKMKKIDDLIIEFKNIHNDTYDYSNVIYKGKNIEIQIICKEHGKFYQLPYVHLRGSGCTKCSSKGFSKGQIEWLQYIAKKENIFIQHAMNIGEFKIPETRYRADGYCEETNTIWEYNGEFTHGHPKFYKPQDINSLNKKTFGELYIKTLEKELIIKEKGYHLITIWEHEWKQFKKDNNI